MKSECDMVREFHEKFGFSLDKDLDTYTDVDISRILRVLGTELVEIANRWKDQAEKAQEDGDERLYRAHLMVEELGETLQSLGLRDKVLTADGLTDLKYVVEGTLITYGFPSRALFEEVHASNMTKSRDPTDRRMRRKDPARGYKKPDIEGVLRRHNVR